MRAYENALNLCKEVAEDGVGKRFVTLLKARRDELADELREKDESHELYRAQGGLRVLEDMLIDLGQLRR